MNEARLKLLFEKFLDDSLSKEEKEEFLLLAAESDATALLRSYLDQHELPDDAWVAMPDGYSQSVLASIAAPEQQSGIATATKRRSLTRVKVWSFAAAAAVIWVCVMVGYKYFGQRDTIDSKVVLGSSSVIKDANPGNKGAILTLSNGQRFALDSAVKGALTTGITNGDDLLNVSGECTVRYATLQTPYGKQQQVRLSDGSLAWLNAGSSIRFPTVFKGGQRIVEITGEVYFEVVHNDKMPFIVKAAGQQIKDLGTHFDVNAYSDEPFVKTTLLEGSVQIGKIVLQPGEQYGNGRVSKVDADGAAAWVFGYFHFDHADIQTVMRQLSRWYNIEVEYQGTPPSQVFGGDIQRSLKLSQVLDVLTGTEIHYTLYGDKIIIHS